MVTLSVVDSLVLDIHRLLQLTTLIKKQNHNRSFHDHLLMTITILGIWFTKDYIGIEEALCYSGDS